jgi:hypothetical protein
MKKFRGNNPPTFSKPTVTTKKPQVILSNNSKNISAIELETKRVAPLLMKGCTAFSMNGKATTPRFGVEKPSDSAAGVIGGPGSTKGLPFRAKKSGNATVYAGR